jgi:acyl-CoA reductase-like NAD-dependent aldehyde dehydrogenase
LNLGGHNIAYIDESFEDDKLMEMAVEKCLWGVFYNSGQSRTSVEGILVHQSISSKFINMFTEKVFNTLKLQDPRDDTCNYGCVTDSDYI